jgi:hypothetical protein
MVRVVLSVVLVTGLALCSACSFNAEGIGVRVDAQVDGRDGRVDAPTDSLAGEASPDMTPDLPLTDLIGDQPLTDIILPDAAILCSSWTPAPKHFKPCAVGAPTAGLSLSTPGVWIYNTDTGWLTDPNASGTSPQNKKLTLGSVVVRVVSVTSFVLAKGVTLRAKGNLPLVLAAWTSATVDGTIDASSARDLMSGKQTLGAGGNAAVCSTGAPTAGKSSSGKGGGGGGGGFGEDGGDGGDGDGGSAVKGSLGASAPAPLSMVRGGCPGAKGGASGGGSSGWGGGALQITARAAITVTGKLLAGASGGNGGVTLSSGGGGGGGSGGYLGLEAPTVTLSSAILAANGGGGGGGAASNVPGLPGANGQPSAAFAAGGVGAVFGAAGGNGGTGGYKGKLTGQAGKSAPIGGGGGGGGGGAGHLVITSSNYNDNNAVISAEVTTQ